MKTQNALVAGHINAQDAERCLGMKRNEIRISPLWLRVLGRIYYRFWAYWFINDWVNGV